MEQAPDDGAAPDATPDTNRRGRAAAGLFGGSVALGRRSARSAPDPEATAGVIDELFFEDDRRGPYLARFATLLVLSTTIAGFGLLADSAAVVIGAMLIAPLMTPILAMSASIVQGWTSRMVVAAAILVGGTLGAIATGWIIAWLAGAYVRTSNLPGELLARTSPSLLDLGVAVAAGYAAGYVMLHREANSALPGAGIAVALVPPLAAVGILIQLGEGDLASGALLLYLTNLAAIVLAGGLALLVGGFAPSLASPEQRRRVRRGLLIAAAAVLAVAVPLGVYTAGVIADQQLAQTVSDVVPEWDPSTTVIQLDVDASGAIHEVDLIVEGEVPSQAAWKLADLIADRHPHPLRVTVQNRVEQVDVAEVR